ncbi:hypothetical protein V1264_019896 [Littorina saxatilis]|uniref:Galectin n=1 Tax=Littorina saxatilis TaxID=31220 RepID=A0AAN9GBI3_9CAEN
MCYLHPVLDTSGSGTPGDVIVYSDSDPVCKLEDAPILNDADVATWHRSLTSLKGDVTCKTDFMHVGDDTPIVRCLATGQWETSYSCKQRMWRNEISRDYKFLLPDTPSAGWSACFIGVPSDETQFAIHFWDSSGNIVLQVNPRFDHGGLRKVTFLSYMLQGGWRNYEILADPDPTFPFAKGQQFNLTATATGSRSLELYVDGNVYAANVTLRLDINTITNIEMVVDVRMSFMDLWCG